MILDIAILAGICVLQFVMKIPYFNLPLDRDYGGHGYVAYCWLKGTGLMYRDIFESKTPGLKIIYMAIIKWLGINRKAFRLFFALYNTVTTIAVYVLAAKLFSGKAGLIAAALYALFSSMPSLWWHFSNTEGYYVLPSLCSFICIAYTKNMSLTASIILLLSAGTFSGITFMFKQTALINTTIPTVLFLLISAPHAIVMNGTVFSAGFLLPVIVFIVYFVVIHKTPWKKTPFGSVVFNNINVYLKTPLFKVNRNAIESNRRRIRGIMYDISFLIVFAVGGACLQINNNSTFGYIIVFWLAFSLLSTIISRTYLAYHFIPMIPPMCVLSGYSIMELYAQGSNLVLIGLDASHAIAIWAFIVLALMFLYQLIKDLKMPKELLGAFYSGEDTIHSICEEVGKYIKKTTKETDFVYSWGHQPDIYFWSERRAAVEWIFPPITNPVMFSKEHNEKELEQLQKNKPVYFVMTAEFGQFKEFEQFLIANYMLLQKFDPYVYLFKRK